jgi:protein gp37
MATKIEWTDVTDNIIVAEGGGWWRRHISSGCDNCYAEALNQNSFFGGNGLPYW